MATFSERKDGSWRVQICVDRVRRSKCLPTEHEARQWARLTESRMRRKAEMRMAMALGAVSQHIPIRVMEAVASLPIDKEHIVATAAPTTASAIYFLIREGEITYVGKSIDVMSRIARHRRDGTYTFDSYNILPCPPERLDELEGVYITALMPKYNRNFGRAA